MRDGGWEGLGEVGYWASRMVLMLVVRMARLPVHGGKVEGDIPFFAIASRLQSKLEIATAYNSKQRKAHADGFKKRRSGKSFLRRVLQYFCPLH